MSLEASGTLASGQASSRIAWLWFTPSVPPRMFFPLSSQSVVLLSPTLLSAHPCKGLALDTGVLHTDYKQGYSSPVCGLRERWAGVPG